MNEKLDFLMDKVILNEATIPEKTLFDELLDSDPRLASVFKERMIALEAIRAEGNDELRKKFEKIHEETIQNKKNGFAKYAKLLVVFLVLGLLSLVFYNQYSSKTLSSVNDEEQLFAELYTPYDASFGRRDQSDELLVKAEKSYRQGDFINSKNHLAILAAKGSDNPEVLLALGNSFYNLEQYQEAIAVFKEVITLDNKLYVDPAKWYLAFSKYKLEDKEGAVELLLELKNNADSDYQEKATLLLNKLLEN